MVGNMRNLTTIYSDLNQYKELDENLVVNVDAIYQHIHNLIINISKRELVFRPDVGTNLHKYLFEPIDDKTAFSMETAIVESIRKYEPRVIIVSNSTNIIPDPLNHKYDVTIIFKIKGLTDSYEYSGEILSKYGG
jgi:phage baseplate assembly protein W